MNYFFCCDWGTSAFRLKLVEGESMKVLSAVKTDHGIARAFECWKQPKHQEKDRVAFYQAYLLEQVKKITSTLNNPFYNSPIILAGMASSSIGMMELPYKELPFKCDGSDLVVHMIPQVENNPYKMIMISGVKSESDVIRGEETMLAGCNIRKNDTEQLFIFPGTHSKHINVKNGLAESITTYMTGELFDLLSNKSILSDSVKKNDPEQNADDRFFVDGVLNGKVSNLANSIFHVRTNQLFKKTTPGENYQYLSGLLIGHELKEVAENRPAAITLVCSEELKNAYMEALTALGLGNHLQYKNGDDALIAGQLKIMQQYA